MENFEVGRIAGLYISLVKSCALEAVSEANLTKAGFKGDREYMIVSELTNPDGNHPFITQRDSRLSIAKDLKIDTLVDQYRSDRSQYFAKLALIKPRLADYGLTLIMPGMQVCIDPAESGRTLPVTIHKEVVETIDQGDGVAAVLSRYLDFRVRLVRAAGPFSRESRQNYVENDNPMQLQDGYPVMWLSQASLDELSEIGDFTYRVEMFRPNILVDGISAQFEHQVEAGVVADIPFLNPRPCDRCSITSIDPETGNLLPKDNLPLAVLNRYKKWLDNDGKRNVIFGEYMLPQGEGVIKIGDQILFQQLRNPQLKYGS